MLSVFLNVVLPIFVLALMGAVLHRAKRLAISSLNQLALYLFTPALTFNALTRTAISAAEGLQIAALVVAQVGIMALLGLLVGRVGRLDGKTMSAFLLAVVFMNAGNYGLPMNLLAFGESGLERATVYYVSQTVCTGTLAVFIATNGAANFVTSLSAMLKAPIIYSTLAAVLVRTAAIPLPPLVTTPVGLAANAALPLMLVLLGAQLATITSVESPRAIAGVVAMRLMVSPFVALLLGATVGLPLLTRNVLVLQAAMPTAVATTIFATEYGAHPTFVTSAVIVTTIASLLTLTVVLALLGVSP